VVVATPVVDAIVDADVLDQFVETYLPISSEGRLHFDEDGLHAKIVDPANVAMAFTDLSTAAFESYESGEVVIGVNLERLSEALSVADSGDLAHFTVDMETRTCHLELGHVDQTIRLIDPDAIRTEPDTPDLELPNEVVVPAAELDTAATVGEMVSGHLAIEGDPEAEEVRLAAAGDIEDSTVTLGHDQTSDANVTEATQSVFSIEYVADLVDPIPSDADVTVSFGDEFPMTWEWTASDGDQRTTTMIAPRIQST
jgi:proliferating cell nuclear antigen